MKNRTLIAVEQQIAAMGCEIYEIGLFKPHTPDSDPREPEMLPRTWDRATLVKSVPWLRYQNSQGRNIYIRPKGEHHLSMVDDLTAGAIDRMNVEGYSPALVVETSPGNFQAWLNHGEILPQRLSTLAARAIAEKFGGDKGAADWRHFGRLAGFTNRKEKYCGASGRFPFVRIADCGIGRTYNVAGQLLTTLRIQTERARRNPIWPAKTTERQDLLSIEAFRANPKYSADGNRIDLAYAVYATANGLSDDLVVTAIRSRDLSKKGTDNRQEEYAKRTVAKAKDYARNFPCR